MVDLTIDHTVVDLNFTSQVGTRITLWIGSLRTATALDGPAEYAGSSSLSGQWHRWSTRKKEETPERYGRVSLSSAC